MNEQDKRVRDYYQNICMPQEKMDRLLKATADAEKMSGDTPGSIPGEGSNEISGGQSIAPISWLLQLAGRPRVAGTAIACMCLMTLVLSAWLFNASSERTEHTLREVAMNHTTRLEPEFLGGSLAKLDNSMHQLPFTLVLPKSMAGEYELAGARYCSLSGVLAAHVKLQDKQSGQSMSLFVTSNAAELEDIQPQQQSIDGVEVDLWREGGLFYALARRS